VLQSKTLMGVVSNRTVRNGTISIRARPAGDNPIGVAQVIMADSEIGGKVAVERMMSATGVRGTFDVEQTQIHLANSKKLAPKKLKMKVGGAELSFCNGDKTIKTISYTSISRWKATDPESAVKKIVIDLIDKTIIGSVSLELTTASKTMDGEGVQTKISALLQELCRPEPMALWRAAQAGDVAEVIRQIGIGGDKEETDGDGKTPLFIAVMKGHMKHQAVVKALLEAKVDLDRMSDKGYTPLYMAAHKGNADMVGLMNGVFPRINNAFLIH
jgi:hypothetical protein